VEIKYYEFKNVTYGCSLKVEPGVRPEGLTWKPNLTVKRKGGHLKDISLGWTLGGGDPRVDPEFGTWRWWQYMKWAYQKLARS